MKVVKERRRRRRREMRIMVRQTNFMRKKIMTRKRILGLHF